MTINKTTGLALGAFRNSTTDYYVWRSSGGNLGFGNVGVPYSGGAAFGDNLFMLMGSGAFAVRTSPDGNTWTTRDAIPGLTSFGELIFANGFFVVGGTSLVNGVSTATFFRSSNGVSWEAIPAPTLGTGVLSLTYSTGLNLYAASSTSLGDVFVSSDLSNWTQRSTAGSGSLNNIEFSGGSLVIVKGSSGAVSIAEPTIIEVEKPNALSSGVISFEYKGEIVTASA
jgi:hypothetical protein